MAQVWNVLYAGPGLAGVSTSIATIARGCVPEPTLKQLRSSSCATSFTCEQGPQPVRLLHEYYSNLYVPRLVDALHERPPEPNASPDRWDPIAHRNELVPGWREVAAFLPVVHGIVFVVDSQPERIDAGVERLGFLETNLRDFGRALGDVALVFQCNKRDIVTAAAMDTLREAFRWPGHARFVESVARTGFGVREALSARITSMSE